MSQPRRPPTIEELLQHRGFVQNLARRLVLDEESAADVAQQTWLKAFTRPPSHGTSLRSWLSRVVRSVAISRFHAEASRRYVEERRGHERPRREVEPTDQEALRLELSRALARLSSSCERTVRMRYFDGLDLAQIAEREGVSIETVRSRIKRSLKVLRGTLDRSSICERGSWRGSLLALAGIQLAPSAEPVVSGPSILRVPAVPQARTLLAVLAACSVPLLVAAPFWSSRVDAPGPPAPGPTTARVDAPRPEVHGDVDLGRERSLGVLPSAASGVEVLLVDASTGRPVPERAVRLQRVDRLPRPPALEARSDARGQARFDDLSSGVWRVSAQGASPPPFALAEGERRREQLALSPGVRVEGTVVLPDGSAAEGAIVWVSTPGRRDEGREWCRCDARGHFTLDDVDRRSWIGARGLDQRPSNLRWCRDLRAGEDVRFALREGVGLNGRVLDLAGAPVEGALLSIEFETPRPHIDRTGVLAAAPPQDSATTASDGTFRMPGALLRDATLRVSRAGFADLERPLHLIGSGLRHGEDSLELRMTPLLRDRIPRRDVRTIRGTLLGAEGEPVAGAHLLARPETWTPAPHEYFACDEHEPLETITDARGRFLLRAEGERVSYVLFHLAAGGVEAPPVAVLRVEAADDEPVLRERRPATSSIVGVWNGSTRGQPDDVGGSDSEAVVLLAAPTLPGVLATTVSLAAPSFRFEGLLAGPYSVSILSTSELTDLATVEVEPGIELHLDRLAPDPPGALRVRVDTGAEDVELAQGRAWLWSAGGQRWLAMKGKAYGTCGFHDDGTLWFDGLAPGPYELTIFLDDFVPQHLMVEVVPGEQHTREVRMWHGTSHRLLFTSASTTEARVDLNLLDEQGRTVCPLHMVLRDASVVRTMELDPGRYELRSPERGEHDWSASIEVDVPSQTSMIDLSELLAARQR